MISFDIILKFCIRSCLASDENSSVFEEGNSDHKEINWKSPYHYMPETHRVYSLETFKALSAVLLYCPVHAFKTKR